MNTRHLVNHELLPLLDATPPFDFNSDFLPAARAAIIARFEAEPAPVIEPDIRLIPGAEKAPPVEIRIFIPSGKARRRPAIFHVHGGGMVVGTARMMDGNNAAYAARHDAVVVSVSYRLAPETPYPGPIDDCYAGLSWLAENAENLGVDPDRIVLLGESAGGGLAAALAIMARDRKGPAIAGQILIYPMLDHRVGSFTHPGNPTTGEFIWTRASNQFGWNAMRGDQPINPENIGYFSPALAEDLSNLPPAFITVGSLDLFLDENVEYALKLSAAGVPIELKVYPGCFHGFNQLENAAISQRFLRDLNDAIGRALVL